MCKSTPFAGSPASPARISGGEERQVAKYNMYTRHPRPYPTCAHPRLVSQAWTAAPEGRGDRLLWLA